MSKAKPHKREKSSIKPKSAILTGLSPHDEEQDDLSCCLVCGQFPTIGDTGLCGPCCYGTADAIGEF